MQTKIKKIITIILIVLVISLLLYLLISQVEIFQAYAQDTRGDRDRMALLGLDVNPNLYWKPCPFCYKHKDQVFYVYFQFNCPGCNATPADRYNLICPICNDSDSSSSCSSSSSSSGEARD